MVRLIHPFVDLREKLAEDIGAGFFIDILTLVVLGLLLLRVEVDIGLIEITPHVRLLESSIVLKALDVSDEIAEAVDTVGCNIFSVTITVVNLFLSEGNCTCFGRPLLLAYSERGLMTCPGAFIIPYLLFHCA